MSQYSPVFPARRVFAFTLMFVAAYMVCISARAQDAVIVGPGDSIQLNADDRALITGTITAIDNDGALMIDSAGRQMKVSLRDVDLKADTDSIFEPGMSVTIQGEMSGEDFGVPIIRAKTITASETPGAVIQDQTRVVP